MSKVGGSIFFSNLLFINKTLVLVVKIYTKMFENFGISGQNLYKNVLFLTSFA